jgi:mono/diheme cytochrome c family protein
MRAGGEKEQTMFSRILIVTLSLTMACGAADLAAGKADYTHHCKNCHGANGVANPAIAKMMKVTIPDLSSREVQKMSNAELRKVITDGKGKMPAIHGISGSAVDDVVAYVRTMKK